MKENKTKQTILIAAPLGFQLTPLSRRLGRFEMEEKEGISVRRFWFLDSSILLFKSGYGRKVAGESVRSAVEAYHPDFVIYANIVSGLRPDFRVGDPFLVSSAALWPGDSFTLSIDRALGLNSNYEYLHMPLVRKVKGGKPVRRARVLTMDQYVNSVKEKRKLGTAGYDLVDLEFASVSAALHDYNHHELIGLAVVSDSLFHQFPSFQPDTSMESRQQPIPPKLKVNMKKATQSLGGLIHLWLRALQQNHSV